MLPTPIAPTTPMFGGVAINPPSSKLAALAGLLAGLRSGYGDIQKGHEQDALRQQALAQQAKQDAFEQQRIDIANRNAQDEALARSAEVANKTTDNTTNLLKPLETAAIGTPVASTLGDAAYGRGNAPGIDPTAASAGQPLITSLATSLLGGRAPAQPHTVDFGGVKVPGAAPNPAYTYTAAGSATTQRLAADEVKKQQGMQSFVSGMRAGKKISDPEMILAMHDAGLSAADMAAAYPKAPTTSFQHGPVLGPDGRAVEGNFNPSTGKWSDTAGNEIANPRPAPTAAETALNAPPYIIKDGSDEDKIAKQLADGSMTFAQYRSLLQRDQNQSRKMAIETRAQTYNPDFNPATMEQDFKYASATQTQRAAGSIIRAIPALDKIIAISNSVPRETSITAVNALLQKTGAQFGDMKLNNLQQLQQILGLELGGALGGGVIDDMRQKTGVSLVDPAPTAGVAAQNMALVRQYLATSLAQIKTQSGVYGKKYVIPDATTASKPRKQTPNGWIEQQPDGGWVTIPAPGGK